MQTDSYILCGGKSKRFGSDKALYEINGKTVIEIITGELKKVFNNTAIVTDKKEKYSFLNLECINDIYRNCGPLAGIHTALKHTHAAKVFIISCDMPFITETVIKAIIGHKTDEDITVPKAGEIRHTLCALYSKNVLWRAEAILEQTKDMDRCASPRDLMNISGYDIIDFDLMKDFDTHPFFNFNSPGDLSL